MNITQFVTRVRDVLDDPSKSKWSDHEIVRHCDEQVKSLYRIIFRSNKEWSNIALHLKAADARQIFRDTYEWRLPTWIERVIEVFERTAASDSTQPASQSSYLWTDPQNVDPNRQLQKSDPRRRDGWTWEGNYTLRLWGRSSCPALTVFCQALPSPMMKGLISTLYADATGFYRPSTLLLGDPLNQEVGVFINSEFEVSATSDITSTNLGEVRRVVASVPNAIVLGTRQHEMRVEAPWLSALALNDTIETRIPVAAIESRLLTLMVANACAQKKFNFDIQKSIAGELAEAKRDFANYAEAPRDNAGPFWYTSNGGRNGGNYDPNRLNRAVWLGL